MQKQNTGQRNMQKQDARAGWNARAGCMQEHAKVTFQDKAGQDQAEDRQALELDKNLYGKVTLLRGDPSLIKRLCISLAIKLQPLGQPLFIDSANSFDPYIIQKTCRSRAKDVLNNILISRPFTLYQLKSLVYNLEELAAEHKVVIISSIDLLARDFQGKEKELALVLEQVLSHLRQVAQEHGLVVFAGCHDIVPAGFIDRFADYAYTV